MRVVGISGNDTISVNSLIGVADLATVNVYGDSGDDTFNILPAAAQTMNVDGGIPIPPATPGDTLNVDVTGTTSATFSSTTTANGGQGSYTFGNRAPVNFGEIETLASTGAADLVLTKTGSPNPVSAGDILTYTITLTNSGAIDASNVRVTDPPVPGTTPVGWSQSSGPAASTGFDGTNFFASWTTFAAGATATLTYVVRVNSDAAFGSAISNTANVTTTAPETTTVNVADAETASAGSRAYRSGTKSAARESAARIQWRATTKAWDSNMAAVLQAFALK